jgi:hypothetical protein
LPLCRNVAINATAFPIASGPLRRSSTGLSRSTVDHASSCQGRIEWAMRIGLQLPGPDRMGHADRPAAACGDMSMRPGAPCIS